MNKPALLLAAALVALTAGCLDSDQEYTLNPDGSGKVKVKASSVSKLADFGIKQSPEDMLRSAVVDTLEKSKGVDAWTDVTASLGDDGRTNFSGTAYFKDVSQLRLNIMGVESDFPHLVVKKEADGSLSVEATPEPKGGGADAPPAEKPTEEQIKEQMKEERAKFNSLSRILEGFLKDLKLKARVILPGPVAESRNFRKVGDNAVEVTLDGKTVLKTMNDLVMDDAFLRKQMLQGRALTKSGPPPDDAVMEKLFGEKGPVRAVSKGPLKAAFDYEAEAAGPRAAAADLLKKFGAKAPLPPPVAGEGFKALRVGGVKIVHLADNERGLSPLGESRPGLTISLVGDFSGPVIAAKEGELKKALTDSGASLLPADEFDRRISFPRLTQDRSTMEFELHLGVLPPKTTGLKEISGTIQYVLAGKSKEVDLGFGELVKGAKGKALNALIQEVEETPFQEGYQGITVKMEVERDAVEAVLFFDAAGKAIEASPGSESSSETECSLGFTLKGKVPAKGRVVVKLFQDLKVYEIPFSIKDLDLLGQPKK